MNIQPHYLQDEAGLAEFLAAFEAARLPKQEWTHAAHIVMAGVFLRRYEDGVLGPTRAALQRFLASIGAPPTAYNETMTIFWLAVVDGFLRDGKCVTDLEAAMATHEAFGDARKLHLEFYSSDPLRDEAARAAWIAPNLKPLNVTFRIG